jgi:hypothetical protein
VDGTKEEAQRYLRVRAGNLNARVTDEHGKIKRGKEMKLLCKYG